MYDGILKLQLPKGVTIIGFADDIGVTIVAQDIDEIEVLTNEAIFEIRSWLEEAGLTLAEHKTGAVLITKRRKQTSIKIRIPIDILANEDRRLYDQSYAIGESYTNRRQLARSDSILEWQKDWDDSPKGGWTHRIIPDVSKCIKGRHGEVSYHLTQFLSEHGGYRAYLYRFGRDNSPYYPKCVMIPEDAEHVVFNCPRFAAHRAEAEIDAGARLTLENIVDQLRRKVTNNDRSRRRPAPR